ncbi:DNA-directed RNA polymerases II 24 kDa polypeptide (RNA polymerase II subunit 5) [Kalmusia sp. IMI 367209]|nr:DNA-directed RNA polymerases II 24 kDa polypeptide (RNA polymerase II subunit 5) [Kalmusia sp. IMI 367209]
MAERNPKQEATLDLWRIYRTTKEMAKDRGYDILQEECDIQLPEFAAKFTNEAGDVMRASMNYSCQPSEDMIRKYTPPATTKNPNPEPAIGPMWIEFNSEESVGMKDLRQFIQHLVTNQYYSGIMVVIKPLSGMAMRALRAASSMGDGPKGGVEVFLEQDLKINITKHELVPTHLLLSTEEKQQLLKRYRLKETQLPRIQVTDPVAKYYGLRRGQVVKIIRKSETAGRYASYRWAI